MNCGWMACSPQRRQPLCGTVLYPDGAAVPDATVVIKNPSTGVTRNTVSGKDGTFIFNSAVPAACKPCPVRGAHPAGPIGNVVEWPDGIPDPARLRHRGFFVCGTDARLGAGPDRGLPGHTNRNATGQGREHPNHACSN